MLKFNSLMVASVEAETAGAVRIAFSVPPELREDYRFIQGQRVNLRRQIGGEEIRRSYSLCGSPSDDKLSIAVKRVTDGRFSTFANDELRRGDVLDVMTPSGRFHTELDPVQRKRYVAFAAGSGITPVISNLRTILTTEPMSQVILFYGNRTAASIMFRSELAGLKDRYMERMSVHHVLSAEPQESGLFNGRLDPGRAAELMTRLCPYESVDEYFICGPGSMPRELGELLSGLGVPKSRIHVERFAALPASVPRRPSTKTQFAGDSANRVVHRATVIMDGAHRQFEVTPDDQNILDAARRQGLDLPFSCKGGVCSTCRARLVEGRVDMAVNYALEPWELEAGYILACQSRPLSEYLLIDYDQN